MSPWRWVCGKEIEGRRVFTWRNSLLLGRSLSELWLVYPSQKRPTGLIVGCIQPPSSLPAGHRKIRIWFSCPLLAWPLSLSQPSRPSRIHGFCIHKAKRNAEVSPKLGAFPTGKWKISSVTPASLQESVQASPILQGKGQRVRGSASTIPINLGKPAWWF